MDYRSSTNFVTNIIEICKDLPHKQWLFEFEFSINRPDYEDRFLTNLLVDVSSNYIGVWICKGEKLLYELTGEDFVNLSNHDSCWRSDGMRWIFDIYIEMRDQLMQDEPQISVEEANNSVKFGPALFFRHAVSFEKERNDGMVRVKNFKPFVENK